MYFVLEQFFESQRQNPAKGATAGERALAEAQEHIRDYFSQPENTEFFDKNKIR